MIQLLETEKEVLSLNENEELKETFIKEAEISTDEQNGLQNTYEVLYDDHIELKKEYDNLLERHECFIGNFNNDSTIPNKEMNVISKEKEGLEREIDLLNGQISLIEGSKKRSEETIKKMEDELMKIKSENDSLKTNCQNETLTHDGEPHAYQTELDQIKQELLDTKLDLSKQQDAYKLLKQESLADVDNDLQQMRQELHKLMGVIEIKDTEIEDLAKQLKIAQKQLYRQEESMKQMKETVQKIEAKSASDLCSEIAPTTASSNDGTTSKQNGDHPDGLPVENQFPGVTLRSNSMVEGLGSGLGSVDETVRSGEVPSLPNDERLQSLIAKYRNPTDQASIPEKPRVVGRPHSVGPGSNFGGISRLLAFSTPKPFYLSSGGGGGSVSKFNRISGTPLTSLNPSPPPATANAVTSPTPTSPVPISTDITGVSSSSPASAFSSTLNTTEAVPKPSPVKFVVPNRPPVPPPRPASRPASRPSSAHNSESSESTVNGVMSPPSPAATVDEDTTVVDATEEIDANTIITI